MRKLLARRHEVGPRTRRNFLVTSIGWWGLSIWLLGCSSRLGSINVLQPAFDGFGVKLLSPEVVGRSCRTSIFGIPLQPGDPEVQEAIAQILALDAEGDVVTDAHIGSERILTGVYNRRCVWVRGNLGRTIRIITLPMPASHQNHH
jgi:hypothetical protein